MSTLFLVTSAIHTRHGIYSAGERLDQTVRTLASIRTKAPGAKIVLIECGADRSIAEDELAALQPYLTDVFNFHHDSQVRELYVASENNWDVVKNATELVAFCKSLRLVLNEHIHLLGDMQRVFKVSGRYVLNDNFDLATHLRPEAGDAYIFGRRRWSQFPPITTGGLSEQVMSRCWSWPASKTGLVFFRYNLMIEDFLSSHRQGRYRDIEHLLLRYFDGPDLVEIPVMGIEGNTGPTGESISD